MSALLTPGVSAAAAAVPGSGIREIVNLAFALPDVVHLEIGEPDFLTPAHIVEAGHATSAAANRYTHSAGTPVLRAAITERLHRLYGLERAPDQIVVSQGAVQGIAAVFAAILTPGDEVLVPDPAWPNYEMQTILNGGHAVHYPLRAENGFLPDLAEIESLFTPSTRILVLNTPSNPTGVVFPPELVAALVEAAADRGITVLADEVYDEILFEGTHTNAFAIAPEHVVSVWSFSKTYAMTGSRVGYLTGPDWLTPTLARLQEPLLSSISAASQASALAALQGPQDVVGEMVATYRTRRDLVVDRLTAAGIDVTVPSGAFYLMLPLGDGVDSRVAAIDLVHHGVATAPGTAFGDTARSHLRLSLASSVEQLTTGMDRILAWYAETSGGRQ
ncbi:aminotransferase class I/II-fold pyridoxal phosphate-dependent enzyme [Nakamurella sp. YIM 132087]|uniref:Aminotransferase n=1 Tax=Nakamurella alba TaxID=2665158 RepID=A0A7K1FPG0_9ACTN|nr:aminotransferase class I/II-fold pyridoxal phosphate-dependent enzyme [Nakamurella alba]MTD15103.1 aminotransferase class I/II-fold pyridoxal phosphate-dependent enzyme [Nakamurella alba]